MKRTFSATLLAVVAALLPATASARKASCTVSTEKDKVLVGLPGEVTLQFALEDGLLLGLNRAAVDGVELTSDDTVQRPILAEEFGDGRMVWPLLKFVEAKATDTGVEIHCRLLGTTDEQAYRETFVFRGDREKALGEAMTDKLRKLKKLRDEAIPAFDPYLAEDQQVAQLAKRVAELKEEFEQANKNRRPKARRRYENNLRRLKALKASVRPLLAEKHDKLREPMARIRAFNEALEARALEVGNIHRDFYRFPHLQQPERICTVSAVRKLADRLENGLKPGGMLVWVIEPEQRNIAGWQWTGWKQHYRIETPSGRKVNVLRQLGTWELGGKVEGLTVANLRYRGLGEIEHRFRTDKDGAVTNSFTTTEIMPGAVGGAYAISPVVPKAGSKELSDRGYALQHRVEAWICRMARGAGHGFVDYQFRPGAAACSFYEKQGNLRALTEAFPGDRFVSQTDEEYFALADKHTTQKQVYLALVNTDKPLTQAENRNRWQEVDQHVRDQVSEELKFVQYEPLPGIGILSDAGWAGYYKGLAEGGLKGWADKGVRLVAYHNPGWVNGRYQGPDGPPKTGGGVCNIYDWWPTKDVVEPWRSFQVACGREEVAFYPWLGQTQWKDAPFCKRVGYDLKHWSLNTPFDDHGPGYGGENLKGNIYDETFRKEFLGQFERLHRQEGYQGFWADSFQNLFMSQLNWAGETNKATSMQRGWWEQIAAWSRDGIGWMAESHSFPGMSCSIEVHGWEDDFWYLQHVWKWYRGNHQTHYKPEQLDSICFRVMSCKGWTAPDHSYKTHADFAIPSFQRLAEEYLAAHADMRRPFVLPRGRGMLWLPYSGDGEGVYFAIEKAEIPDGVEATYILDEDGKAVETAQAERTYRVRGGDLPTLFGVRRGPLKDPRLGRKYKAPEYNWPVGPEDK